MLALAGTMAMIIGTLAGPAIQLIFGGRLLGDIVTPLGGAALLARIAALVAAMFFLPDIISGAVVGWRRILALTLVVVIAASMVAQSNAIGGPWEVAKIAATGLHVLATCAWLGGLLALATVLIPGDKVQELDQLIPLIKVSIFGLMLLMGNEGRKYAARAAFRLQHQEPDVPVRAGGMSTLAVVMGAELCIAFVILSTTSLLVMVAPHP
jgi:putative copper export protein